MTRAGGWRCARCETFNLPSADSCRRCGAPPAAASVRLRRGARDHAGLAAALSLLLPGLGQLYAARARRALLALAIPLAVAAVVALVLAVVDPLLALALRVAAGLAAAAVVLLAAYHTGVVVDAFVAPSTRGAGLRGKRRDEYATLAACLALLAIVYVVLLRQATAWGTIATRVFEPFQQQGGQSGASWSGADRMNVLLLGIDTRQAAAGETQNTDTIIVLTVDPLNKAAGMLSIPRDTLVPIPGHGEGKVNAAFALGGPDLARKTVSQLLGVPLHAYALVDFTGFRRIVDAVGGVVVDAPLPVRDESYPTEDFGITRLDLRAGPQLMAGETALRYSRSRHDSNDFSRAERQQRVITALRHRAGQQDVLLRVPALVDDLADAVKTDLDPANAVPLARLGLSIDAGAIERAVLKPSVNGEPGQLREVNSPESYYLVPIPSAIASVVSALFYDPQVRQEAAKVEIRAPAARSSLADELRADLEARHFTIMGVTDGAAQARTTVLLRNQAKRYSAEALARTLGVSVTQDSSQGGADVIAVLGDDYRGLAAGR